MPADAKPVPLDGQTPRRGTMRAAATATALGTFALTFGPYLDLAGAPTYVGMTGKLTLTQPMVNSLTGGTISQPLTVTIGADGTATIPGLVFNDDPNVTAGTQYSVQWDVGRFSPSPGNKTFTVPRSAGAVIDFDLIAVAVTSAPAPVPAGLDALVAALLLDPTSATHAAALNLPNYPHA